MPQSPSSMISLGLTIPGDNRFLDTVRELAQRVAEYVGYPARDARGIGESVDRAIAGVLGASLQRRSTDHIEVTFCTDNAEMSIQIRYHGASGGRAALTGDELERSVRGGPDGARALDAMRRGMDRVEFGQERGVPFCRLSRHLP